MAADERVRAGVGRIVEADSARATSATSPSLACTGGLTTGPNHCSSSTCCRVTTHATSPWAWVGRRSRSSVAPVRACSQRNRPSPDEWWTKRSSSVDGAIVLLADVDLTVVGGDHQRGAGGQRVDDRGHQAVGRHQLGVVVRRRSRARGRPCRCRRSTRRRTARPTRSSWPTVTGRLDAARQPRRHRAAQVRGGERAGLEVGLADDGHRLTHERRERLHALRLVDAPGVAAADRCASARTLSTSPPTSMR